MRFEKKHQQENLDWNQAQRDYDCRPSDPREYLASIAVVVGEVISSSSGKTERANLAQDERDQAEEGEIAAVLYPQHPRYENPATNQESLNGEAAQYGY
jgi:hypothetical protein